MKPFPRAVCIGVCLAVSACNSESQNIGTQTNSDKDNIAGVSDLAGRPDMGFGTIGPVTYKFDRQRLVPAEIEIPVPPAYDESIWGIKLLPASRAAMLGNENCIYGNSRQTQLCDAEHEIGLEMAMLERPLPFYRDAFTSATIPEDELRRTNLMGQTGFAFTASAEGSGTEYRFIPVDGRTLLIARRFSRTNDAGSRAIAETIRSLKPE
ncbi:hypothetical protein D6851_07975 [Altericroceibacterium spongiae]|uniref:Uncharacterized protein n=1 Tax=Altericroceibacterium spongiae TaxID=2320269 RepID=A0A420EMN7_9SPHN|nr:hypothetical protein [Altericroceibacterium spongiae]RKF21940.1 hypothetical protein D6851_07975 [Altericroceibacterium spongiae]